MTDESTGNSTDRQTDGGPQPAGQPGGESEDGGPTSAPRDRVGPGAEGNTAKLADEPGVGPNKVDPGAGTPARADFTEAPVGAQGGSPADEAAQRDSTTAGASATGLAEAAATDRASVLDAAPAETVATRKGMFGIRGPGDTSGYGGLVRRIQLPHSSEPPYGEWFDQLVDDLAAALGTDGYALGDAVESVLSDRGELTLFVRRESLLRVVRHLRDDQDLRFEFCSGVSGVHFPEDTDRELHAVYHLLSMTHNRRIRLVVTCPDADPHIPSVYSVYPTSDWHERETWDFFGIIFDGHPALTRIEMPDDWPGHPQRKDYPLGGIPVEYKGATISPPDERRSYT